jgi:hypothetical protein
MDRRNFLRVVATGGALAGITGVPANTEAADLHERAAEPELALPTDDCVLLTRSSGPIDWMIIRRRGGARPALEIEAMQDLEFGDFGTAIQIPILDQATYRIRSRTPYEIVHPTRHELLDHLNVMFDETVAIAIFQEQDGDIHIVARAVAPASNWT